MKKIDPEVDRDPKVGAPKDGRDPKVGAPKDDRDPKVGGPEAGLPWRAVVALPQT